MSFEEYWIGKNVDLEALWADFEQGDGYIDKVSHSKLYLLRLKFGGHPRHLPLFDHELIYKTVKATFHDIKEAYLTPEDYDSAGPIFVYRVDRGSAIYEFLAELGPLIPYAATLGAAIVGYVSLRTKEQDLLEKDITFLQSKFPRAKSSDMAQFVGTRLPFRRRAIVQKMIKEGHLEGVEISKKPFTGKSPPENEAVLDVVASLKAQDAHDGDG